MYNTDYANPKCEKKDEQNCSKDTQMYSIVGEELGEGYIYRSLCLNCYIRTLTEMGRHWKRKYNNLKSVIIFLVFCAIVAIFQLIFDI